MAYLKGEQLEEGIWHLADGDGYLVDITVVDPESGKRIRRRKTTHRQDLARGWRNKTKGDALRGK